MNNRTTKTIGIRLIGATAVVLSASAVVASLGNSNPQAFNVQVEHCEEQATAHKLYARPRTYKLINGEIQQRLPREHAVIWERISALIPAQQRHAITSLSIHNDGNDEDGSVAMHEDGKTWDMRINGQLAYNIDELEHTIIHEYAHILSLNSQQVNPEVEPENCFTFDPGEGCSYGDSFINEFHNQFWAGRYNDNGADESSDEFVTGYAASDPIEDFAESFTFFTLGKTPISNTVQAKYDLIASFPELYNLAAHMQAELLGEHPADSCH